MSYVAYLCYARPFDGDDEDDEAIEPEIKFEEPPSYRYDVIIPIQFSVLNNWTSKDKGIHT